MSDTYESGYRSTLSRKFSVADTTMYVATNPTKTEGRIYFKSGTQEEWVSFTGIATSPNRLTGCVRQLSKTADPATSGGDGFDWIAGTPITLVAMHDQMLDKQQADAALLSAWVFADTTARDAALGGDGVATRNYTNVKTTADGIFWRYNTTTNAWEEEDTGTVTPNGSETVSGSYEEGTQTQTDSGDATGETGADLVSTPQKIGRSAQKNAWIKGEDAGGDDAYVVTLTPAPTAYVDGMEILLKATTGNTGACSVDVNGLGVKSIKTPGGNDPQNGDIPAGKWKRLRYNGTDFAIVDGHQATITEIGSSKMASDATALAGTNETDYINSLQLKNWSGYTVYPEQGTALANLVSLLQSANTSRINTSLTYIKVKEIVATIAGTYTVYFEIKADVSTTAYGRIYVDGVAVGTERSTTSTSYVGYLENITVTEGQLIQLYYKKTGTNGHYAKDFRLYGFIKPVSLTLTVNTD